MERVQHAHGEVLVVEDDDALAAMIGTLLENSGYEATVVGCGGDALTTLLRASKLPDLILLDLMMPNVDGAAFRAVQRMHPEWRDIPVIVLSAAHSGETIAEELKVVDYLPKPFNPQQLLKLVDQYCNADLS